jgi:hypothetical protein
MCEARCKVCGRSPCTEADATVTSEYTVNFNGLCVGCASTLARAFAGIVALLHEAHGEKRERTLAKLMDRLNEQGFDTAPFHRRSA